MFENGPTIITKSSSNSSPAPIKKHFSSKKTIIEVLVVVIIAATIIGVFLFKVHNNKKEVKKVETIIEASSSPKAVINLPDFTPQPKASSTASSSPLFNLAIERISFADFYKEPTSQITPNFSDYQLPLNIKIDVINYYDVSRKLNLDPGLEDLNQTGFAIINNPWTKQDPDFYAIYESLNQKQIPLLITPDFLIYYYQNLLKKSFKDIEKNVFYNNLWSINKKLYTLAKNRYEAHLAMVGDINDPILEGERLEAAYFAVSLELLKPAPKQIIQKGMSNDNLFDKYDVNSFYFVVPPYLRDDVLREVNLIKAGKQKTKSPVLLYVRNYQDFTVPNEYRSNAKLHNFYLTTKWLNSVFPLNYKSKDCPNCLLDKEDWRINLITASLIAHDFSDSAELENKWARIYKMISYFKGLRENLNYLQYNDSLVSLFGKDYDIKQIFGDKNKSNQVNLEKLRKKLLSYKFKAIQGAWDQNSPATQSKLGFKMLVDNYWPNNYFFSRLIYPTTGSYKGKVTQDNNVTACSINNVISRCNGFALDIINLVHPVLNNNYFQENTNYNNYSTESLKLAEQLNNSKIWHSTNYWSTLGIIKSFLEVDRSKLPNFTHSDNWNNRSLQTAVGAWINLQLPLDKFSVNQVFSGQSLNDFSRWGENSYVEPNLNLINSLIANNKMFIGMLAALQINDDVNSVSLNLQIANNYLAALRDIAIKELKGEKLSADDNATIINFAKQFKIEEKYNPNKGIELTSSQTKKSLKENLSSLKLMVLVHQEGKNKIFSVGPVWSYKESH